MAPGFSQWVYSPRKVSEVKEDGDHIWGKGHHSRLLSVFFVGFLASCKVSSQEQEN